MDAAVAESGSGGHRRESKPSHTSLCIVRRCRCPPSAASSRSSAPTGGRTSASIVLASLAMGMTVLIPWLVGQTVNAIDDGDESALLPLALAIVGAGLLRLALTASRRIVAGKVSLAVEYDLRERIYTPPAVARARLLRLPADRPADVAGDRRPAVDPVLPRLRADLHHPERADAGPRRGDHVRPPARPRRARPAAGPVRRLHGRALQPDLAAGAAGGPAADRRAHRRGRGVRLRRPRRQGVRARGAHARPLPQPGHAGSSTRTSTRPGCAPSTTR